MKEEQSWLVQKALSEQIKKHTGRQKKKASNASDTDRLDEIDGKENNAKKL